MHSLMRMPTWTIRFVIFSFSDRSGRLNLHKDNEGMTPLMYASKKGSVEVLQRLIAAGANVNVDASGTTEL
jgi:ankyrin repeat protein